MKALIGVDIALDCSAAIDLFRALDFPTEKVILLHAVESVMPDGSFPGYMAAGTLGDIMEEMEQAGKTALHKAAEGLPGVPVEEKVVLGDPFRSILHAADDEQVDLIAICSHKKSALEAFIAGSVTRGLLTASTHSFLAAKPAPATTPLKVVFATDHSDYSKRCADLLVSYGPKGIGRLVVASVLDDKTRAKFVEAATEGELGADPEAWAQERLGRDNEAMCKKLSQVSPDCTSVVMKGHPNEAIREVMRSEGATLLIVGAQGQGFFERLRSGSVSFHQVVAEDYSVLVLRLPAN